MRLRRSGIWIRRYAFRVASLGIAAVLAWGWKPGGGIVMSLPAWSPFVAVTAAVAARRLAWSTCFGLPILAAALWKGRAFCRHVCPTGLLLEAVSRASQRFHRPHSRHCRGLGRILAALTLGGAVVGVPWFLWLDPLVLLNGALAPPSGTTRSLLYGLGLGFLSLWTVAYPWRWCAELCPLGATQEWLPRTCRKLSTRVQKCFAPKESPGFHNGQETSLGLTRRAFVGLAAGAAAALVWRRGWARSRPRVIRPPGSVPDPQFQVLCARCGNCVRVCPAGIVRPDLGASGWSGLMTPRLILDHSYCSPWCHACTRVCPTGAIRRLSEEDKQRWIIGKAQVHRDRCLAWAHGRLCMVCQEFCHYHAIREIRRGEVPCPVVRQEACRGCGACQSHCPAVEGKAIVVYPVVPHSVGATAEPERGA